MIKYIYRHFAIFYDCTEITEYFSYDEIENLRKIYDTLNARYEKIFYEKYRALMNDKDHIVDSHSAKYKAALQASDSLRKFYLYPDCMYYATYSGLNPEHIILKFNGIRESSMYYVYRGRRPTEPKDAILQNMISAKHLKTQKQMRDYLDSIAISASEVQISANDLRNILIDCGEDH